MLSATVWTTGSLSQGCDLSANSRIFAAQGSSLTVLVNRVNSLRKFEGGG